MRGYVHIHLNVRSKQEETNSIYERNCSVAACVSLVELPCMSG